MFIRKIEKDNKYTVQYTCKLCGAKYAYETNKCLVCGWIFDENQNKNQNLDNGKNILSFNKYKCVFYRNEDILLGMEQEYLQGVIRVLYNKNPKYYNNYDMSEIDKLILSKRKASDNPPYKCKLCGLGDIEHCNDICDYCGWEDDGVQNEEHDYIGGANEMSLNQYKMFWEENKEDILKNLKTIRFYAIEKSQDYYIKHFKKINDSKLEKEEIEIQKLYTLAKELKNKK